MNKQIRVLLVEDDFYACNSMELLLRRDWRTKVVREAHDAVELSSVLAEINEHREHVDLVLIDTDIPSDQSWLNNVLRELEKQSPKTAILFTGISPNYQIAKLLPHSSFAGYILKDEICYSLAWAVTLAASRHIVITPGLGHLFEDHNHLPAGSLILDGRKTISSLSDLDKKRIRMAFVYSMERSEFAHEEELTDDSSYGAVSELFDKIGLNDVLTGEVEPEDYFGDHPGVLEHVKQAIETIRAAERKALEEAQTPKPLKKKKEGDKMPKIKEKETLAFHLLTLPDIEEVF